GAPGGGPQSAHLERLELERLLSREVVLADQVLGAGKKVLVLEHQQLGVENTGLVRPGALGGPGPDLLDVTFHVPHGGAQAAHLLLHLGARHDVVRHLGQRPAHRHGGGDGDARGDPDSLQQPLAHGVSGVSCPSVSSSAASAGGSISWKPSATSASSASIDSAASAPSVLMDSEEPHSAASIITPMMLLPFTVSSSLRSSTADWNRFATLTSSAAGRACSPSGFTL